MILIDFQEMHDSKIEHFPEILWKVYEIAMILKQESIIISNDF